MNENEIYFDMEQAGFLPEYAFVGGPGRVFFDTATKQFLRIEPLGGAPKQAEPPAQQEPLQGGSSEQSSTNNVENPVENQPGNEGGQTA